MPINNLHNLLRSYSPAHFSCVPMDHYEIIHSCSHSQQECNYIERIGTSFSEEATQMFSSLGSIKSSNNGTFFNHMAKGLSESLETGYNWHKITVPEKSEIVEHEVQES